MGGDDGIYNEKTGRKEEMTKKILFWNLPNILVIILKRFSNNNEKNNECIDFPVKI